MPPPLARRTITTRERRSHESTRLSRARPAVLGLRPDPSIIEPTDAIVRIDTSTICGTDLHILKGDVPEVKPGTILGHEAVGTVVEIGAAVTTVAAGRSRARFVHQLVRTLPILQGRALRPVHRWRRLDLRPHDRRPSGRVRPRPVRRHLGLQGAGGPDRRAGAVPRRHPADGIRGRRSERRRPAGRHRRRRRCRPDRARDDHDREALHARPDHRDRPRRRPAREGAASSAPTSRSTTATRTRSRG